MKKDTFNFLLCTAPPPLVPSPRPSHSCGIVTILTTNSGTGAHLEGGRIWEPVVVSAPGEELHRHIGK